MEEPDKGNSHGFLFLPRIRSSSNMQSLLTASENNVLQSFLSVMDYPDDALTAKEWALLSSHSAATSSDNASFVESATPNSEHKEALAKATKDLMSLETEHWRAMQNTQDPVRGLQLEFHHRRQQSGLGLNTSFSFSQGKLQLDPQLANMNGVKPSSSSTNPHSSPSDDQHQIVPPQPSHQLMDSSSNRHLRSSTRNMTTSSSSSRQAGHPSSASSSSTPSSSSSQCTSKHTSSSKRNCTSSSTSPSSSETPLVTPAQKQPLLSPSQKKANHIQSEQKRRANIRRGYEALCETVPALREAIKQEEEEAALVAENLTGRRKRKKGQGKESNGEKDKIDGRSGPRSENVVLTKTIEHIQDLLSDRSALLARLHHARSTLSTGHPALTPVQLDPPWERVWNGGEGRVIPDGEEEGASSEGDE